MQLNPDTHVNFQGYDVQDIYLLTRIISNIFLKSIFQNEQKIRISLTKVEISERTKYEFLFCSFYAIFPLNNFYYAFIFC